MTKKVRISKRNTALLAALFSFAGITVSSSVTAVGPQEVKVVPGEGQATAAQAHLSAASKIADHLRPPAAGAILNDESLHLAPSSVQDVPNDQAVDAEQKIPPDEMVRVRRVLIQPLLGSDGESLDYVSQVDNPTEEVKSITGHGKRQRVVAAIQKIVPSGWSGFSSDDGIKESMRVTWREKDAPWPEVLNKILSQANLKALINWEKKEVDIMANVVVASSSDMVVSKIPVSSTEKPQLKKTESPVGLTAPKESGRSEVSDTGRRAQSMSSKESSVGVSGGKQVRVAMASDLKSPVLVRSGGYAHRVGSVIQTENRRTGAYAVTQPAAHADTEQRVMMLKDIDAEARMASIAASEADDLAREVAKAELADAQATILQVQNNKPTSATYVGSSNQAVGSVPERYRRIRSEGISSTRNVLVQSAGFNIPLLTALADVSPKGWLIYSKDGNFSSKMLTAWKGGGRPWLEVVDEMLTAHNLTAVVRHNSREIQIIPSN